MTSSREWVMEIRYPDAPPNRGYKRDWSRRGYLDPRCHLQILAMTLDAGIESLAERARYLTTRDQQFPTPEYRLRNLKTNEVIYGAIF